MVAVSVEGGGMTCSVPSGGKTSSLVAIGTTKATYLTVSVVGNDVHCKELPGFKYHHDMVRDVHFDISVSVVLGAKTRVHTPAVGESEAYNGLHGSILSSEPKPLVQHRPPPQYVWSSLLLLLILKDFFYQVVEVADGLMEWPEVMLGFIHIRPWKSIIVSHAEAKVVDLVLLGSIGGGSGYIGAPPPLPITGGGTGDNPQVVFISNLDAGNPLYVHNSDNSSSVLVPFKLLGTENYRMWNNAMKLALQARNKYGFFDGTCLRDSFADSDVLCAQWDMCNAMVLTWIINVGSSDVYMGLVYYENAADVWKELNETYDKVFLMGLDECYQPVRNAILTRDPLPDVKDAYATVSREESHRGIPETLKVIDTKMHATSFAANLIIKTKGNCGFIGHTIERCYELIGYPPGYKKPNPPKQNTFKPNFNANCDTKGSDKQPSACNSLTSFNADQMQKLFNLINDSTSGNTQANMAGRVSFFNGNAWFNVNFSKFYCGNTKFLIKTITMGWIINSGANQHLTTSTIGMTNVVDISNLNITIGHPNGTVALLVTLDSKLFVDFDEDKCYIQDLDKGITLGTGSESEGLYLFDDSENKSLVFLSVKLAMAKQTREPFPLSDHKSVNPGELVHLDLLALTRFLAERVLDVDYTNDAELVTFFDNQTKLRPNDDDSATPCDNILSKGNFQDESPAHNDIVSSGDNSEEEQPSVRRSSRPFRLLAKFNDFMLDSKLKYGIEKHVNHSKLNSINYCFATTLNKSVEPSTYYDAVKDARWVEAMNNEIESLIRNNTWTITDLPIGRSCGQRFSQKEGINFDETFSPVVKMVTVRCLICIVVSNDWPLYQLDVNNAFLYGDLNEGIYMSLPLGFECADKNKVCKLNKALYGLKQAPRQWNAKLTTVLVEHGFVQSKYDYSLYLKHTNEVFVAFLVYVADFIITGNSLDEIENFKVYFISKFMIKDLGVMKYFFGIEVLDNANGICMNERKYCLDLIHEFGLLAAKPVTTPLPENCVLAVDESESDKFLKNSF
nr:ribonuclease H-like domain-containing protein [Tanacetum cinerariifolium]